MQHSIGELKSSVDRLVTEGDKHGTKIDELRHQASFIKGGIAVGVILISVFIAIASFFLTEKWDAVIQALRAASKP
jgi:hypothetical protein